MSWFDVDRDGLRQVHERLIERRGFGIVMGELYQNVMDTNATECRIATTKLEGLPRAEIVIEDDGPGFEDLGPGFEDKGPGFEDDGPCLG